MNAARPPVLLVLVVLALHLLAGREVQRLHAGWASDHALPPPARMNVQFVREMVPQPPPGLSAPPRARPATLPAQPPAATPAALRTATAPEVAPEVAPTAAKPSEPVIEAAVVPTQAASQAAGADAATREGEPGAEWPLSTRLSYELSGHYRGPVSGQAQVEWLRKGQDYQVHLDVVIGPGFAPLVTRRMSSTGRLTRHGIAPQSYDEQTRVIFTEPRRFSLGFLGGEGPTYDANGAAQSAAQDAASQFVQLTWLFLTGREPMAAGRVVRFPLRLPSGAYDWEYESVGEEVLDTPMGPLTAWHLKPRRTAGGSDLTAEVWLAPTLQFLPVRLLIRQSASSHIDLVLKNAPLQAAPESATPSAEPRKPPP